MRTRDDANNAGAQCVTGGSGKLYGKRTKYILAALCFDHGDFACSSALFVGAAHTIQRRLEYNVTAITRFITAGAMVLITRTPSGVTTWSGINLRTQIESL